MKETFITKRFGVEALALLELIHAILERYNAQGLRLSLRQLYYQLVAANSVENTERSYKNVGNLVSEARLAGLIDWDAIEDRGRNTLSSPHWSSPKQFMDSVVPQFAINKWLDQPAYVEVMVEKQALEGVLHPVCVSLDIAFTANKGYSSSSALYECAKRFEEKIQEGKACHIIYLGDHDPSGIDMTRDVLERINLYANVEQDRDFCGLGESVDVKRVALNQDQIRRLNPPRNPAKLTDSRANDYIARFGSSSWELDAIEPAALGGLVRDAVHELRDLDKWGASSKREVAMRRELESFAKKSKFK